MLAVAARHEFGGFTLDAAFEAPSGITALFGASGSGKSTVLAVVAGLLRPRVGRVALDGTVLLDTAAGVEVAAERRRCGVVFQDAKLLPHLSVETNLRYGARRAPKEPAAGAALSALADITALGTAFAVPPFGTDRFAMDRHRQWPGLAEVVALLGIGPLLRRRPRALSGGERQRVALGRALLSRPRLLLMDEPLAALDAPRKAEILPFLERLRDVSGVPILYVTHALDEVDRLADTLVLMEAGRVVAAGPLEALTARPDLPLLSGRRDAGVVLACTVAAHDPTRGLTQLGFAGGRFEVPLRAEPPGARLRLRVQARDVAVATEAPRGLSSHNVLPAAVVSVAPAGAHEGYVTLHVGPTPLLARLTRDAIARLGLAPGLEVFALVKSTAFDPG